MRDAKSFADVLAGDRTYQQLAAKSLRLAESRMSLPTGSTRARVTTANARWARAAEARDAREAMLRVMFDRAEAVAAFGGKGAA